MYLIVLPCYIILIKLLNFLNVKSHKNQLAISIVLILMISYALGLVKGLGEHFLHNRGLTFTNGQPSDLQNSQKPACIINQFYRMWHKDF